MDQSDPLFADNFRTDPYWWNQVPRDSQACLPAEALPDRADVVVLEAGPLGFGASTRNGGMVSGGVNVGKHATVAPGQADEMLAEAAESHGWFEQFIDNEEIDAVYQRCGRFSARIQGRLGAGSIPSLPA